MTAPRRLLAALPLLALAALAPASAPDWSTISRHDPIPATLAATRATPERFVPADRPRWPEDWPISVPMPEGSHSATQSMGSGEIDITLVGTSAGEAAGAGEAAPPPPPPFPEDPESGTHLTRGHWESHYAPPQRHETTGANASGLRPPPFPPGQRHLTRGRLESTLVPEGLHIAEGALASGYRGIDDRPQPPPGRPAGAEPVAEGAPGARPEAESPDDEDREGVDEPQDEPQNRNRPVHLVYEDQASRYVDFTADDEEPGDDESDGEPPAVDEPANGEDRDGEDPFGEDPEIVPPPMVHVEGGSAQVAPSTLLVGISDEEIARMGESIRAIADDAADEGGATPAPATGYRFTTPDGQPLNGVILSQEFLIELRVTPDEASVPGRAGGRRELDFVTVTLTSEDGEEATVRLHRADQLSEDGLVRFVTREPVSVAGQWGGVLNISSATYYPGTIEDLDLDLGDTGGRQTVRLSVPGITGGFTAIRVYGDKIQAGIAEIGQTLDVVEGILRNDRQVAQTMFDDPAAAGDEKLQAALRAWLQRIDGQLGIVAMARNRIQNEELPIFQFRYGSALLNAIITRGPDGWEIRDEVPTAVQLGDVLFPIDKDRRDNYGGSAVIVPQAAMGVVNAYAVGMYSTFAHVTLAGPLIQLLYGVDEFGQEGSRGWALVEIGIGLAMIKLPPAVIEALASGRQFGFTIRIPGRGGAAGGTPIPAGRPGRLGVETGGGQLAYPGRGGARRGLDAETIQFWRQKTNPRSQYFIDDFNDQISMLDSDVATARLHGVPDEVVTAVLTEARGLPGLTDARFFFSTRMQFEIAIRNGQRIYTSAQGKARLGAIADDRPDVGVRPVDLDHVRVIDMVTLESVISKSQLEQAGRPQLWTVDEIRYGREIKRRLEAGEDLSQWKTVVDEKLDAGDPSIGIHPLFGADDLGAVRATFDGRPLRIAPEAPPAAGGGRAAGRQPVTDPDEAPTVPPDELPTVPPDELPTVRPAGVPGRGIPADDVTPTQRIEGRQPTERGLVGRSVDPVAEPNTLGGPSGRGGASRPIEILVRSVGGSTGPVMEAFFVNHGTEDVRIRGDLLVLEPVDELDADDRLRMGEILDAASSGKPLPPPTVMVGLGAGPAPLPREWQSANVVRVVLDAYCLDFAGGVPAEGTVFRIADPGVQQANARYRAIIGASRRLADAGALHPDSDPDAYFHSIRQWAIWVDERGLDRAGFEADFVDHTRRNLTAAGRTWTAESERVVRGLVPNRWSDLAAVLGEAGLR